MLGEKNGGEHRYVREVLLQPGGVPVFMQAPCGARRTGLRVPPTRWTGRTAGHCLSKFDGGGVGIASKPGWAVYWLWGAGPLLGTSTPGQPMHSSGRRGWVGGDPTEGRIRWLWGWGEKHKVGGGKKKNRADRGPIPWRLFKCSRSGFTQRSRCAATRGGDDPSGPCGKTAVCGWGGIAGKGGTRGPGGVPIKGRWSGCRGRLRHAGGGAWGSALLSTKKTPEVAGNGAWPGRGGDRAGRRRGRGIAVWWGAVVRRLGFGVLPFGIRPTVVEPGSYPYHTRGMRKLDLAEPRGCVQTQAFVGGNTAVGPRQRWWGVSAL